jgi:hypothetical protein
MGLFSLLSEEQLGSAVTTLRALAQQSFEKEKILYNMGNMRYADAKELTRAL